MLLKEVIAAPKFSLHGVRYPEIGINPTGGPGISNANHGVWMPIDADDLADYTRIGGVVFRHKPSLITATGAAPCAFLRKKQLAFQRWSPTVHIRQIESH
jgi:hypothetical protein